MTYTEIVTDRSAWTGADLQSDRSWCYELDAHQIDEINTAVAAVLERGLSVAEITAADFPLPTVGPILARISNEVEHGRGFALLRGVPVDRPFEESEIISWGVMTYLGTGVTQNSDASLIHYVTDGLLRPNQGGRGVGNPGKAGLHVDLADCAALLCVRQAPDNPPSWVASSIQVHNVLAAEHPDVLPLLYGGFEWDRLDEHGAGETPTSGYRVPMFSEVGGTISCRYNRYWMAAARKRDGGSWSAAERAALDLFDEIAHASRLEVDFGAGDLQFINNYTVLHGRDGHAPEPDEARKRVLMRIWVDFANPRPTVDDAIVRYGIIRHGNLGWTAAELRNGLVGSARERRPDGAPAL